MPTPLMQPPGFRPPGIEAPEGPTASTPTLLGPPIQGGSSTPPIKPIPSPTPYSGGNPPMRPPGIAPGPITPPYTGGNPPQHPIDPKMGGQPTTPPTPMWSNDHDALQQKLASMDPAQRHVPVWMHPDLVPHIAKAFGPSGMVMPHPGVTYPMSQPQSSGMQPRSLQSAALSQSAGLSPGDNGGEGGFNDGTGTQGTGTQPGTTRPNIVVHGGDPSSGGTQDGINWEPWGGTGTGFTSPLGTQYNFSGPTGQWTNSEGIPRATAVDPAQDPYGLSGGYSPGYMGGGGGAPSSLMQGWGAAVRQGR